MRGRAVQKECRVHNLITTKANDPSDNEPSNASLDVTDFEPSKQHADGVRECDDKVHDQNSSKETT